jgi:hypothetical protein
VSSRAVWIDAIRVDPCRMIDTRAGPPFTSY